MYLLSYILRWLHAELIILYTRTLSQSTRRYKPSDFNKLIKYPEPNIFAKNIIRTTYLQSPFSFESDMINDVNTSSFIGKSPISIAAILNRTDMVSVMRKYEAL